MRVRVLIPTLIAQAIHAPFLEVDAATFAEAVERVRAHPQVGPLCFDESGALRQKLLLLLNDRLARTLPSQDVPLRAGDEVEIVQSVWGG